ncbi:MAG: hypothetical protein LT071_10050 [Nocardioides sp.]|nr:hypothetical protein [Nocardioides sp.]
MTTPYVAASLAAPSVPVALVAAYALVLLAVAWGFDVMSQRVARRSNSWRTGTFTYHEDHDAWQCPEDQWLWPKSFDPENRVMRYRASPSVCNGCPVKKTCTTSDHGREITREYDPWPYSEAGKFHRGISVMVAVVALVLPGAMLLFGTHNLTDVLVLTGTILGVLLASMPLARHLWHTPDGFPEHVSQDLVYRPVAKRDPYKTTWGTQGKA